MPSQPPLVFALEDDFARLPSCESLTLSPRISLSERQVREFQKTAEVISQEPWHMDAGCAFLLQLVESNQSNSCESWVPLHMPWLLAGTRAEVEVSEPDVPQLTDKTFAWNHRAPATVKVSRPPSTLRRLKVKGKTTAADDDGGAVQLPPPAESEGEQLQQDPAERPHQNLQLGAPDSAFGRGGAPISVAAIDPPEGKAKAKCTAKVKAKAKGNTKAKGKAKAKAQGRAAEPQPTGSKPAAVTSLKRPA